MNPQTPSSPSPSPEGMTPHPGEQIKPNPELMQAPAEATGVGNANASAGATPMAPVLTASDVAAAIAQMPADAPAAGTVAGPPTEAADQDVIEPEWVDQAEAVIAKTAGDPHAEEEAVESLQVDYLAKRYGHQVKKDSNNS